jgi:glycosyltransferase 2 family protein
VTREATAAERGAPGTAPASRSRNLLGLAISAVSLAGVAWWASRQDRPRFPTAPGDLALVVAAVALYAVVTFARAWRWHRILMRAGIEHRRADAYGLTVVAYMGNAVLPARGGELLRILLMAERSTARRREVLGSILAERLLDAATLLIVFSFLSWTGLGGSTVGKGLAAAALAALAGASIALAAYLALRRRGKLDRFARTVRPVALASRLLLGRVGVLLGGVTMAVWALEGAVLWLVVNALGLDVSYLAAAFLVALTSFVVAVPAAPGYLGTFDAALVFGLGALGVVGGQALAVALLWRFVLFVPVTIAGLVLVFARYGGLPQLRRGVRTEAAEP